MFRRRSKDRQEARREPYAKAETEDDLLDGLSDRLLMDLKEKIHEIAGTELFSEDWLDMVKTLTRLATVVVAEESLESEGKEATLWEADTAALRNILENGKMNILIRLLLQYKSEQRAMTVEGEPKALDEKIQAAAEKYEKSLCTILINAFLHAEVVQTIDIGTVVELVSDCFHFAVTRPECLVERIDKTLESAGFSMIYNIVRRSEELGEDRVMDGIRKQGLFPLLVQHLRTNQARLSDLAILDAIRSIASIIDTEDYGINEEEYLDSTSATVLNFVQLEDLVNEFYENRDSTTRKQVRPMYDEIRRIKRISGTNKK